MNYVFANPVTFEKTEYTQVELKLEDMSGATLKNLKRDYLKQVKLANPVMQSVTVLMWDDDFCIFAACKFSDQPIEFFENLPVNEYAGVIGSVQSFFNGLGAAKTEA